MSIVIGRVVALGKVHMHIDGRGCGVKHRARITHPVRNEMLMWVKPADLCKRCFTSRRLQTAAEINTYGRRWSQPLDSFLNRVPVALPQSTERTHPDRLAETKRQILATLRENGTLVNR